MGQRKKKQQKKSAEGSKISPKRNPEVPVSEDKKF